MPQASPTPEETEIAHLKTVVATLTHERAMIGKQRDEAQAQARLLEALLNDLLDKMLDKVSG